MEALRVGLVGLNFGRKVVTSGIRNNLIKLVACYSRTPSSREAFAEEFDCAPCDTYREMVERDDLEAVIITSPNHEHLGHAYEAATRGKHVFIDKPIANSIKEAEEIKEAAT